MKNDEYFDRSCYGEDRSNEMPHWGGNLIYAITYPISKLFWRVHPKNREIIRDLQGKTGFVIVANHVSFLDVFCIYNVVRLKQWVRFMARDTLYNNKILGKLLTWAGAFPIKRDAADRKAIKRAARMLKNKEIVGIMPEGTRRGKSGRTPKLHAGAAFIARLGGNVPIVPCTTRNADKVKQKGKLPRFPKITVVFGKPIYLKDFDFLPKEDRIEACTWYAMRECFALFYDIPAKQVDMVKLFPDNRDFTEVFE